MDIRHIVVASRDDHPSAANGVHNVARQLVAEQRAAGHDARLYHLSYHPAQVPLTEGEAVRVLPIIGAAWGGRVVHLKRQIADIILADVGADTVFHIHGGREPLLIGLARRMHVRGLPYALTVHGRFSHVYDSRGECLRRTTALYLNVMERSLLSQARFVQALSSAEAQVLRQIAPHGRIRIVGNGAYSSHLGPAPSPPAARPKSDSYPHFISCGRYAIHHKGLDLLLEGFSQYRKSGGNGRLTTIGSGTMRTRVEQMASALGVADAVTVRGPLFAAERDAMLCHADYFVMPSRYEGLPLAAIEAALLGLPLIVTTETGLGDVVAAHRAGFAIDALTAAAVCRAFQRASGQRATDWAA